MVQVNSKGFVENIFLPVVTQKITLTFGWVFFVKKRKR